MATTKKKRKKRPNPQTGKRALDERISLCLGLDPTEVAGITAEFCHAIMEGLLAGDDVHIPLFGTFHLGPRRGKRPVIARLTHWNPRDNTPLGHSLVDVRVKYYVTFVRARAFTLRVQEKYGKQKVLEQERVNQGGSNGKARR